MLPISVKYIVLLFAILLPLFSASQGFNIPVNQQYAFDLEKKLYDSSETHTSVKPLQLRELGNDEFWNITEIEKNRKLKIFPLLNSNQFVGEELVSYNTLGFGAYGEFYKNWSFQSSVNAGLYQFSEKTNSIIDSTGFLPNGNKYNRNSGNFYGDYNFDFRISYRPFHFLTLVFGNDKHFLGDGYRSLFLSNNAASFPFGNIVLDIWKIKYSVLYCFLKDIEYPDFSQTYSKYNTIHFLSINLTKRFNVNIFESVSWSSRDSINHRGYDINYLNPVIFFRPVEFSLDDPSPDNVLLGLGFKYNFYRNYHFYGQVFVDDFLLSEFKSKNGYWANKQGIQLGIRAFDFLNVQHLFFLSEVNLVRPFTYEHLSSLSAYGNQYESLAHPLGSNFFESLTYVRFRNEKFIFEAKWIYAKYGSDSSNVSLGNDLYKPYTLRIGEYGHELFQGILHEKIKHQYRISYTIWPKFDLYAFAGIKIEQNLNPLAENKIFFNFGLTTHFNFYDPDYLKRH